MDAAPSVYSSSDPKERPWREVLMDAALGLEFVAVVAVLVFTMLRPSPGFDILFWAVFGFAVCVGVFWRWRRLPMGVRAAGAFIPMLPAVYVLSAFGGIFPGVPMAMAVSAALLSIWFGRRVALSFSGVAALVLVAAGYRIASHRGEIHLDVVDPFEIENWIRIALGFVAFSMVLSVTVDWVVREVERHAKERTEAYHLLRRLYVRFEGAKEEERRHLARELHDELGQVLTALKLRLQMAGRSNNLRDSVNLDDTVKLVDELIGHVRKLSVDLSPPLLAEAGLTSAVRAHVESNAGLTDLAVELDLALDERFPPELEVAAFRVVQETLTNTVRHARASRVSISVRRDGPDLVVSVRDDGIGFDYEEAQRAASRGERFGLAGMRERVRGLGGAFNLESCPGRGTAVRVRLPVAGAA